MSHMESGINFISANHAEGIHRLIELIKMSGLDECITVTRINDCPNHLTYILIYQMVPLNFWPSLV